ncbi:hypothetical protein LGH82_29240 [Mesorhizobium sp. PAMC28654]|uniref:hypothetical protein n=1 Tax=Mesorhizobium sp. PAMC28654 TaxID=2880934 RepID=UPI001D099ECF|nr:hypothetical protein [Mesorhizobium sp. PAMC28654]UDL89115.1 hypothetical protein LGH82_29240 [Mesorhizobium sp. PAMC28654]
MKKFLWSISTLVLLVLLGLVSWTIAYSNREKLSDQQLIAIVAGKMARRQLGSISYASAADLVNSNPGCCIARHSNHEWLRAQIIEQGASVVQMNYVIEDTPDVLYYFNESLIDSDGRILESRGIDTKTPIW